MPLFDDVKSAVVYVAYGNLHGGKNEDIVEPYDIYSQQTKEFSNDYLWRAIWRAESDQLIRRVEDGSKYYIITDKGIASVEYARATFERAFRRVCDDKIDPRDENAWKDPDRRGEIGQCELEELRSMLTECRELIDRASLPQQDRAQAEQHIKAAQEIADAPTPRLSVIWDLLKPFTNSFLSEVAKRILNIILPGGS